MKKINMGRRRVAFRARVMRGVKEIHPPPARYVMSND